VFSPEFGGDRSTWRRYAWFVPLEGYWLFAYDNRGTGESSPFPGYIPRKWASDREVADLEGALAYVRTLTANRLSKVCLFGISRGGVASLAVAARDPDCAGVVLEGSGSTLDVIFSYSRKWSKVYAPEWLCDAIPDLFFRGIAWLVLRISEFKVGYRFQIMDWLAPSASGGPCLFIYGERDRHVDQEMAGRAFGAYRGTKEMWMVPRARHNAAVLTEPEEYRRRVLTHFAQVTGTTHVTSELESRTATA
jgi:pimeloyl-ACP methyl ester carboxylesterase